jgi:hypothetical protein
MKKEQLDQAVRIGRLRRANGYRNSLLFHFADLINLGFL